MIKYNCSICGRSFETHKIFEPVNTAICKFCKRKQTYLQKYGVINNSQLKSNKEKVRNTRKNQTKEYKQQRQNKVRKTILAKYGVDNFFKRKDLVQASWLKKYGVDNPSKNKEIRQKQKETCLKKYGNIVYANSLEGQKLRKQNYIFNSENFDSKPELAFYIYCKDKGLNIKRSTKSFEYSYKDKKHIYFPDFEIDNQFFEIKGDQFLAKDGSWQNPFQENDKDYFEAKHQCALKNNVIILYSKDYQKYIDYIEEKYGKDYLQQFRNTTKEK